MASQYQETLIGIPAAPGLAHGKVVIIKQEKLKVPEYDIKNSKEEIQRFDHAIIKSKKEIENFKDTLIEQSMDSEAGIFDAHQMFLADAVLIDRAKDAIREGTNAERAWMDAVEYFAEILEKIPDETLSGRAVDVRDVGNRVLGHLLGADIGRTVLTEASIIFAVDLTPSDTVNFDKDYVLGFCTAEGGPTSHTAVLAKTFGLPAVVGLGKHVLEIPEGTFALVNGHQGEVILKPDDETIKSFLNQEKESKAHQNEARKSAQAPAVTADGEPVEIVANIGSVMDAPLGVKNGAEGIGLFRTEFLYLDRTSLPTEEEQVEAYTAVFGYYLDMPIVVRILDIGGDKVIPYLDMPDELNPFLGWRGIRMLDGKEEIFLSQFRALLQAGGQVDVDLRVMLPMVSSINEITAAKALINRAKSELKMERKAYKENIQFGIMIEVPSAALLADHLAKEVDFFSIGTNDLAQYTLAVDRTNSKVAHLSNPLNPAVLALVKRTIDCAHAEGKWVGLCGELAGEPLATPILLGLGLDEFSMAPTRIPEIKQVVRKLHKKECVKLTEEVLTFSSAEAVQRRSRSFLEDLGMNY